MGAQRRLEAIRSHAVGRIAASCAAASHPESPRPLTEEQIKQFIATSVATSPGTARVCRRPGCLP
eukprot:COSAG06_NODE_3021_length_5950_cov_3.010938_6_plen_65_part_00